MKRLIWLLLGLSMLACRQGLPQSDVNSLSGQKQKVVEKGTYLGLTSASLASYPLSIKVGRGSVSSDQPIEVLQTLDLKGEEDNWGLYKDLTPSDKKFSANFIFVPKIALPANAGLEFSINYRGWHKKKQTWKFFIRNYQTKAWTFIGDNAAAKDWVWSLLKFTVPGEAAPFVDSNNTVQLRVVSNGAIENAFIDYMALHASYLAPTPVPPQVPPTEPVPEVPLPEEPLPEEPTPAPEPGQPSDYIWGVTIDGISNIAATTDALSKLAKKPTTRIVFDEFIPASTYLAATKAVHQVSYVMGELLDSFYMKQYSVAKFRDRTTEYVSTLSNYVDIWEIGNEINGEWLGATSDVVAKMQAGYDVVKASGGKVALTLYYNAACYEKAANEMFTWSQANIPASMKQGLDYVWVSYYEDDCNGLQPDWNQVFARVATMFPNSYIGLGEVGTKYADKKVAYINKYYNLKIDQPRFVGGYFWWYFRQDMVPATTTYWKALNNILLQQP